VSKPKIDVAALTIDELGRTILPDDMLDRIEAFDPILSAGANGSCGGSTNASCSNGACGGSSNQWCSNTFACYGASNHNYCVDGPIG
jgi:hypothetical protein